MRHLRFTACPKLQQNWNKQPKKRKTKHKKLLASETLPMLLIIPPYGKGSTACSYQCKAPPHRDRAKPNQSLHSKVHTCCIYCCFSVSSWMGKN